MSDADAPLVFVSHASEDKVRFVTTFATRLRESGVNAWLDKWEIYPGDSLVDRIFEEGLKNASAVIVVLSSNSVSKPWVREELNASVVHRIEKGTRLIPVLIDDVQVPEALRNTVWVRIANLSAYDDELNRIVASIFGTREKPPLGKPPRYSQTTFSVSGLRQQDASVLKLFCEKAIEKDSSLAIDTEEVAVDAERYGIQRPQFLESTQILVEAYLLEDANVMAPISPYFTVTMEGLDRYLHASMPSYREIYRSVAAQIVNGGMTDHREIASAVRQKLIIVEQILDIMERNGLIRQSKAVGRYVSVQSVSPRLRRLLETGA
jgi:hypothetical protein